MLIREAGPVVIDRQPFKKEWLDREIRRDKTRQGPEDDRLGPRRSKLRRRVSHQDDRQALVKEALAAIARLRDGGLRNVAPVLPAMFQLKGRPYQLNDHFTFEPVFNTEVPRRMLFVAGRQVSKCLPLDDEPVIWLADGRLVGTAAVRVGDEVVSMSGDFRRTVRRVLGVHHSGEKQVWRITTRLGAVLEHTAEHRVRTLLGFTAVSELRPGSRVAAMRLGGVFGDLRMSRSRVVLTACLLGDGCCGASGNLSVTSKCDRLTDTCRELAAPLQDFPVRTTRRGTCRVVHFSQRPDGVVRWLKEDGLFGKRAWEKHIPDWVFRLDKPTTREFVSYLWATDGCVKPPKTITYTSTSRTLARQVRSLLAKFGIPASIKRRITTLRGRRHRDAYIVRVETRDGLRRFMEQFDVPGKPGFELPTTRENNNRDTIPIEVREPLVAAYGFASRGHGDTLLSHGLRRRPKHPLTRDKLSRYVRALRKLDADSAALRRLEAMQSEDVIWDEVVSVEPVGSRPTVDFEVEEDHVFVCDGVVTHNSTSVAAQGIFRSISIPHFSTMYVTPLYETVRRFSSNYVRSFIDQSPIRGLMTDSSCNNSVLQRSFRNHSNMFFSFAYHDADRTRGVPCDCNVYDEIQDLNKDHIPIIRETLAASRWKWEQFMGTPKTLENTINLLWQDSSQAQWHIWCDACGYENIPSLEFDIDAMTGPNVVRRKISEESPGVVCAHCGRPVNPRNGQWVHHRPSLRTDFSGYHLPQQILPMHYADPDAWAVLLGKRQGYGNTATHTYYNEVCGESYDTGAKMLTQTDLQQACESRPNTLTHAAALVAQRSYVQRVVSVDWSGGGQDRTSFTVVTALGLRSDGKIDVLFAHRFRNLHDYQGEVRMIIEVMRQLRCTHIVHDFGGAGSIREHLLVNAGLGQEQLVPVWYVAPRIGPIMHYKEPNEDTGQRGYWQCDKSRSLVTTCELVKLGHIRFFEYDFKGSSQPGLLHDFLALIQDVIGSKTGHDVTVILRNELAGPDDFAQAVNIGVAALYDMAGHWPDIAALSRLKLDPSIMQLLAPENPEWDLG